MSRLGRGEVIGTATGDGQGDGAGLAGLVAAVSAWVEHGRAGPLGRWLGRELDPDGVPRRLDLAAWWPALAELDRGARARPDAWPEAFDARAEGWVRAALRFSRPDGVPAFAGTAPARDADRAALARRWADRLSDPGLTTVLDWWFGPPGGRRRSLHAPPPLPADARPDRPLAVLRANWLAEGDLVAVDHRAAGPDTKLDLVAHGRSWLGPNWSSAPADAATTRSRPGFWVTHSSADAAEWSFRSGRARVTRTAVLLRGRKLALFAELWDGPGDPGGWRLGLAEGVVAAPMPDCRGLALTATRARVSPRVLPLGLPRGTYPTDQGALKAAGGGLALTQAVGPRRAWRPLLVSWDPKRDRKPPQWRTLTVTQDRRVCPPDVAFAARVSWGRDETLVVYRSLARPATRAFLGHQTAARLLVGLFTQTGDVEPLLKIEA